jgi:hypothetical protein
LEYAVAGYPNASALTLDFYDRNRVATWVRTHEGLIPWVRQTIEEGDVIAGNLKHCRGSIIAVDRREF